MTWHEKAALVSLPRCWTTVRRTQELQQKVPFLWSIKYKALPDRKNTGLQWVTNMFPYRNCSSPNLEKKWTAGYELHPNHFKSTNPSRLPFEPSQSWELGSILKVCYPSPELETQSCHLPTHLPLTQGWEGQDYPATSLTTGTWKWAFPCNGVEKAVHQSSRK